MTTPGSTSLHTCEQSAAPQNPASHKPPNPLQPPRTANPPPSHTTKAIMAKITSTTKDWEFNFYGIEGGSGFSAVHIPGNAFPVSENTCMF